MNAHRFIILFAAAVMSVVLVSTLSPAQEVSAGHGVPSTPSSYRLLETAWDQKSGNNGCAVKARQTLQWRHLSGGLPGSSGHGWVHLHQSRNIMQNIGTNCNLTVGYHRLASGYDARPLGFVNPPPNQGALVWREPSGFSVPPGQTYTRVMSYRDNMFGSNPMHYYYPHGDFRVTGPAPYDTNTHGLVSTTFAGWEVINPFSVVTILDGLPRKGAGWDIFFMNRSNSTHNAVIYACPLAAGGIGTTFCYRYSYSSQWAYD